MDPVFWRALSRLVPQGPGLTQASRKLFGYRNPDIVRGPGAQVLGQGSTDPGMEDFGMIFAIESSEPE